MPPADTASTSLENVLLMCGEPSSGKSFLLRETIACPPINKAHNRSGPVPMIDLGEGHFLLIRITSPHEMNETLEEFLAKIEKAIDLARRKGATRFSFASACQLNTAKNMPRLEEILTALTERFAPKRMLVACLTPDYRGDQRNKLSEDRKDALRSPPRVEIVEIDATKGNCEHQNATRFAQFLYQG